MENKKNATILVVDDDDSIRNFLRIALERVGYCVQEARHGKEALEIAQNSPPSLIISDILMPIMDGYELCVHLKNDAQLHSVPLIFYTGTYLDEEDEKLGRSFGADDFITRPIALEELLRRIEETLAKRTSAKDNETSAKSGDAFKNFHQYRAALVRKLKEKVEDLRKSKEEIEKILLNHMSMEAKLRESEELFRAVFEQHAAVKLIIDPNTGNILDANYAAEQFYGWSREELKTMRIQQINTLPPEKVKEEMERARTAKRIHFNFQHRRADGTIRDVEVYSSAIKTKNRKFLHSIVHDVTDKKIMELALKESEERYRMLVETQVEAICRWKVDTTLTFVNAAYCAMVGKTREELIGRKWIEFVPQDSREEVLKVYEDAVRKKSPVMYEHEVETPYGRRWYRWHDVPVYNENGELVEFQSVGHDITERVLMEMQLKQSEEKYRLLVENAPCIICTIAKDGTTEYVNPYVQHLLGYSPSEIIGRNWWDLFYPGEMRLQVEKLFLEFSKADVKDYQMILTGKDGVQKNILWNSFNEYSEKGEIIKIRGIGIDITERVEAEGQLKELSENLQKMVETRTHELKKANEELEAFVYTVAHDLRAPVRHIGGFLQFLRQELQATITEKAARWLDVIDEATKHMTLLIDGLLDFARLGKIDLHIQEVDMHRLVHEVLADFKIELERYKFIISCDSFPTLMADPLLLRTVMVNLIGNAIKFTRHKQNPEIRIECSQTETEYIVSVCDNGIGFDMKYADKLFGIFQRLHSGREYGGTGIGLASVKQIIARHGGRVWATGEVDKGACFYFSIPKSLGASTIV